MISKISIGQVEQKVAGPDRTVIEMLETLDNFGIHKITNN